MAWEWSHTQEAYDNAKSNLEALDREKLEIIFAEWRAAQAKHGVIPWNAHFNEKKYNRALAYAKTQTDDDLVEAIWARAEELRTCDNGGFDAWMCPFGCGCHTVSFSTPEELAEEEEAETPT